MLSPQSTLHSTNKECEEKAATGYLVSLETPNRSIDEDLRCSTHWGTKRFYWSPSLQGVSCLYRGWAAWAVPVTPCCGGITGWRPICPTRASCGGQANPGWWPLPPMTFLCCSACVRWLAFFKRTVTERCLHVRVWFPGMMQTGILDKLTLCFIISLSLRTIFLK